MTEIDTSTAAVTALLDGVTAGPWEQDGPISAKIVWAGPDVRVCFMTSDGPASKNARFISAARELVPALAAERDAAVARAEQAEARVAELEAEVEHIATERDTYYAEGFALGWTTAIKAAGEVCESIRIGIANGPMPEGARFDYEQSVCAIAPPADARAALDRLTAQARAQSMREAAEIAAHRHAVCDDAYLKRLREDFAYRALEAKHIEDKIIARAEEIEKEAER